MNSLSTRMTLLAGTLLCASGFLLPGCQKAALGPWRWALPIPGVNARVTEEPAADQGRPALKVQFHKTGEERRFLSLESHYACSPTVPEPQAILLRARLALPPQSQPRLAVTLTEKDGSAWFKVQPLRKVPEGFSDLAISLGSLRKSDFSLSSKEQVDWAQVERVGIGLALDGPADGWLEISRVEFTKDNPVPTAALPLTGESPGIWNVMKDNAAAGQISTPSEGPTGKLCMKFDFTFPLGRHMWALPTLPVGDGDFLGFSALQFTGRAKLPEGLSTLLVEIMERDGSAYYSEPAVGVEWKTLAIPFNQFKPATWSQDENGQLDLTAVGSIVIGIHGTARGTEGKGSIWVSDVWLLP